MLSTSPHPHPAMLSLQAPEQFEGRPINEKVDLYAFAMLMAECLLGEPPWKELEHPMQVRGTVFFS